MIQIFYINGIEFHIVSYKKIYNNIAIIIHNLYGLIWNKIQIK